MKEERLYKRYTIIILRFLNFNLTAPTCWRNKSMFW